ncbi:HtaA domain-containing protein [Microbacterium sp. A8/3-1]|uniref:HtaA domain-containing protein n=1 Tax=Microbacterium sp. A8/3-1 TaxID=3160749 RepID=A0AAU7VYU9_9MICO
MRRLGWGVKASLRHYVEDSSSGHIESRDGAERDGRSVFWFPSVDAVDDADSRIDVLRFAGSVEFVGHHGMLSLPIRDPWLESRRSGYVLSIVDPDDRAARVDFVTVGHIGTGPTGIIGGRVALTADGADLILGPYEEGTEFDDLEVES